MSRDERALRPGLDVLRCAVAEMIAAGRMHATASTAAGGPQTGGQGYPPDSDDLGLRIAALVDLARDGDADAFGQLYDHYSPSIFTFIYYRVSSQVLAEDLLSETFFRALRSMSSFTWQGKDFGAWLMTIARNLVVDHYKAGRTRLESSTDDFSGHHGVTDSPEDEVLVSLTNEILLETIHQLPEEQQTCLIMRFLNENSIAETALALGRTEGAVKQLQLRAVRNLAKLMPEGLR